MEKPLSNVVRRAILLGGAGERLKSLCQIQYNKNDGQSLPEPSKTCWFSAVLRERENDANNREMVICINLMEKA